MYELLNNVFMFAVVPLVVASAALGMWWQSKRREETETRSEIERASLQAAALRGGRITALDVRPRRACTVAEIEERLRWLHAHGYCESELSENGMHLYIFPAFDDAPRRRGLIEKEILLHARMHDGRVDAVRVAMMTDLTYGETHHFLEEMAENGQCHPDGSPGVYLFPSLKTGRDTAFDLEPRRSELLSEAARPVETAREPDGQPQPPPQRTA